MFVSNLPQSTTTTQLASVFSKAGVLLIGDDGEPRIKLYHDEGGKFKGEALVMYFKEGSVDLAVRLLDDTELEMGGGEGNMRVKVAEYGDGKEDEKAAGGEKKNEEALPGTGAAKKSYTAEEKQRMTKRIKAMQKYVLNSALIMSIHTTTSTCSFNLSLRSKLKGFSKVTWHSDSDSDDPLAPSGGAPARGPTGNRMNRVVVLKGMFALSDLDKDPALLLELKEDVREEAESMGEVTNVTLYDVSHCLIRILVTSDRIRNGKLDVVVRI